MTTSATPDTHGRKVDMVAMMAARAQPKPAADGTGIIATLRENDRVMSEGLDEYRRLKRLQDEYGGHIQGNAIYSVTIGKSIGHIFIDENDRPAFKPVRGQPVELPENRPIKASPFVLRDPSTLPEREWLYGKHYIKRYLTATVGAGGGGKSAHAISESLSMVTGKPLLDPNGGLFKPLRVWYINAEDPQDEIDRRFHAAAKHFDVGADDLADRLYTDSGRDQEFVIMRQDGRNLTVCQPLIDDMVAEIKHRKIDVVIIDPLVSTHEVPENDNGAMQRVAKAWTEVADRANCCVEVVHHVVKSKDEVTADSARGGGALKDKTRGMRVINPMTAGEAAKVGLEKPDGYFRIDHGKVNLVASGQSSWRRFASVPLGNGKGPIKKGDEIGVVEPWRWPSADDIADRAAEQKRAVVADVPDELLKGLKVRLQHSGYKADAKGKPWAGDVLVETGIADDSQTAKLMLAAWIDLGELVVTEENDPVSRHPRKFIRPAATI